MNQYETIEYDPSDTSIGATSETLEALVPNYVTRPSVRRKWHVCPICGMAFPEPEMLRVSGAWYCREDGEDLIVSNQRKRSK